jgi:hypothetical protein
VDDEGFSDLPAALQDIGEDGEPYPGSIADPEDAADLLGNNDELEETSGLDGDSSFEIRWNAQVSSSGSFLHFIAITDLQYTAAGQP